ncbi:MAG: LamG domain-containing protein [Lentisphaerae bacterium]|nr:LamG domain-containing protein [Lentisphaerota bacterium]
MKLKTHYRQALPLAGALAVLAVPASLDAGDWYTRYQHTDSGLVAGYNFNAIEVGQIRDEVSRKTAIGENVKSVKGWQPVASYKLEGKKLAFQDIARADARKDFTLVFYGKVSGSGYVVLKKGAFGISVDNGKALVYLRSNKRDYGISVGTCDEAYHTWVLTAQDKTVTIYCDGKRVGGRNLPAPVDANKEAILIGNSGGWKKTEVSGQMGLLRLYSKALSAEEVGSLSAELGKGNVPMPDASLVLQLPMGARNVFIGDDISYEKKELAWYFDGKSSGIRLPDYPELQKNVTALTVGAWIKPENTMPRNINQQGYIISANAGSHYGWSIGTYYNNGLNVNLITDQGKFSATASQVLKRDVWQHVAFTWDGKTIQLFVNGQPVGQSSKATGVLKAYKNRPYIGKAADRNGIYFKGAIDEVRIYNAALAIESDPDTGKAVTVDASNTDYDPLKEPLPRLHGTEKHQPIGEPLCDFEDLSNWTVTGYKNVAEGKLCRSNDDRLWGDYTAKLTIQAGTHFDPARKKVSIAPKTPIVIDKDFDYISIYLSAQNWTKPSGCKLSVEVEDADGKRHTIEMQSAEIPFIFWSGWSAMVKKVPQKIKVPARIINLTFYNFGGQKPEVYYLDNLAVHTLPPTLPAGIEVPSWEEIGAPTVATGAKPVLSTSAQPVKLTKNGNTFTFAAAAGSDKLIYTYTPQSGTLSDITLAFNGKKAFQPAKDGGFRFVAPDGKLLDANAPGLSAKLLNVKQNGSKVVSNWAWSYNGKPLAETALELSVQGKSLAVRLTGGNGKVHEVRTGVAAGLNNEVILTNLPYWVIRSRGVNDPAILYCDKMLLSAVVDIYKSNASALIGGSGKRDGNTYQINGGAAYQLKSDKTRNAVDEVIYFTASTLMEEVVPHIANPKNPTMDITRNGIWVTRMWYDKMPYPTYFDEYYLMWERYHRYGMRNLMIRDHQTLGRQYSPKRRGGYDGMVDTILPDIGGDEKAAEYFKKTTDNLGYRMGLYSNFTLLPSVGSNETMLDKMTLNSDCDTRYGSGGSKMCKYAYILDIQRRVNAELKRKFKLTCTYPDQYTCRAPWAFTDSDARVPEAGKFSPVIRVLAKSLILEREDFAVPLSEGIMQWPLAGFCDSYAQNGSPDDPVFPEFQLRKIQPLSNDCGAHLRLTFAGDPKLIDRYMALSFANGTIGHLFGAVGGTPKRRMAVEKERLKSYYLFKQTQKHYAGVPVKSIEYHYNGKLLTAAEAIAAKAVGHNQIKIVYSNGMTVYVNANAKENWQIKVNGKTIDLLPNGYYLSLPGKVETASIQQDGHRADYSFGDEYVYVNGNGQTTDFGVVKCANAYALLFENNAVEIIPVPFAKAETISIDLSKLPVKAGKTLVKLDVNNKEISREEVKLENGLLKLNINKNVFSFKLI